MSSIPGYTLELFIIWLHNLTVKGTHEANLSIGVAEMLSGVPSKRPCLTQDEFSRIVAEYEPYRDLIESRLDDFDEDTQSWRGYAEIVDIDVPDRVSESASKLIDVFKTRGV